LRPLPCASLCFLALIFSALPVFAQVHSSAALPRVFEINARKLAEAKAHPTPKLLELARREADAALKTHPLSVMDKGSVPPNGDKHEFMSEAGYWWPNPNTPNHLPYVRRDGYRTPETARISDETELNKMLHASRALALGYYLTGEERYAQHAAVLLRTWFLAPATAMRPDFQYAQYIPGLNTGRAAGIVSARNLPEALDAVGMLAGSPSWSAADDAGIKHWFSDYYTWLTTSKQGRQDNRRPNNHGSWHQVQVATIALYLGKTQDARQTLERVREERIPLEIDTQGMQKYEMIRTKSFSYSAMNLQALSLLAAIAEPLGIDLYKPATPGAPGILTAVNALMPYDPQHKWPHQQVEAGREDSLCPALVFAEAYTRALQYSDALKRFACKPTAITIIDLLPLSR
jgi:hypothetical protein